MTSGGCAWTDISGATSTSYTFTATSIEDGYEYRAVFSNSAGSVTTPTATLTITNPTPTAPQITLQPSDQTVVDGDTAGFTACASGYPAPTVRWQVSADSGASWTDIGGATSDTYNFTAEPPQNGDEYQAVFTNRVTSATTDPAILTTETQRASNWAGYFTEGATFTSVSGDWTVPTLTCSAQDAYSSQWIGIDGANNDSVEQDGTEADCSGGTAYYNAWFEMYGDTQGTPQGSGCPGAYYCEVALSPISYPVSPGDSMSAQISVAGSDWTLSIDDTTAGWTFTTTIDSPTPVPAQSSAEWIVERPDVGSPNLPRLADFTSTTFTNANASTGGPSEPISAFAYAPIEMISNTWATTLSTPGPLSTDGTSFTATWLGGGP